MFIGQVGSFYVQAPLLLGGARFLTGLGEGAVFSLVSMSLASCPNAERLWGAISLIGGMATGLLLLVVSLLPQQHDNMPIFLVLAVFTVILVPTFPLIFRQRVKAADGGQLSLLPRRKMATAMSVVFLIYMVQAAQWAVCGFVGERSGLSATEVGIYLAISSIGGFLGAAVPLATSNRARRLSFIITGFLIMAVSIYYLLTVPTPPVFVTTQIFVNIGFYIVTPFLSGIITENDPDGSLMSRILVIAILGAAAGTAFAGPVFADAGAFPFAWLCLLLLGVAAVGASLVFGHLRPRTASQ